jgi:hypothetical protein
MRGFTPRRRARLRRLRTLARERVSERSEARIVLHSLDRFGQLAPPVRVLERGAGKVCLLRDAERIFELDGKQQRR